MRLNFPVLGSLALFAAATLSAATPELKQVKKVYFLQMTAGLDQYIAHQLTLGNVFEVVTNPKLADAIFSDRIGEGLEAKLLELYPPPKPPEDPKVANVKDKEKEKEKEKAKELSKDLAGSGAVTHPPSTWGRGRGNIYLIDRTSRSVLWTSFQKPKNSQAAELDKTASLVVGKLKKDLGLVPVSSKQ